MSQTDKRWREENSLRPQRLTDEQPEMSQTRSESGDKRKREVRWEVVMQWQLLSITIRRRNNQSESGELRGGLRQPRRRSSRLEATALGRIRRCCQPSERQSEPLPQPSNPSLNLLQRWPTFGVLPYTETLCNWLPGRKRPPLIPRRGKRWKGLNGPAR